MILRYTFTPPNNTRMGHLCGPMDSHIRTVEAALQVTIAHRFEQFKIDGPKAKAQQALEVLQALYEMAQRPIPEETVQLMLAGDTALSIAPDGAMALSTRRADLRARTTNQGAYLENIATHDITFGIGPAGTGKSWLAVAMAVQALQAKQVNRIILTRPAVEAGERLGFLPGDLMAKVDPYLRPLFDALHDMIDAEGGARLLERGTIEVAPLAFMRGRAQPVDRKVLTPFGWRAIGDLAVGDLVVGSDGLPTPVLGVFPQGMREVFRVRTQDGAETMACGEHLWFVRTLDDARHGKAGRVLQTQEMVGNLRRAHQRRYELPLVSAPVEFAPHSVPMDPYALGLLLGDGCITTSTTPAFATKDPELVDALAAALPGTEVTHKGGYDYVLNRAGRGRGRTPNPVTTVLRELKVAGTRSSTKFVPFEYLYNSSDVRLAVLQGLLDTDGGPVTQAGRSCRIEFTTCSPELADDVVFLVRSLGGVAYRRVREAASMRPGFARGRAVEHRSDSHRLDIRLPEGIVPFRLERKQRTYARLGGGRPMRFIDSIEPAGETETVCIQVGAQDSLYVTDDFLVTHNTLNNAFIILDEAQNTTPEQMKMFLTRIGFGSKAVITGDVTQIDVPTGRSGLQSLEPILSGIEGLSWVRLTNKDVVRHKIVQDIVDAYERAGVDAPTS